MEQFYFTIEEKHLVRSHVAVLQSLLHEHITASDIDKVYTIMRRGLRERYFRRDKYGINPVLRSLNTARLVAELIVPDRNLTIATLLYNMVRTDYIDMKTIVEQFGDDTGRLVEGLINISQVYKSRAAVENDNFHKLLLTFAKDIRVIIIMIVDRLGLMREINHHPNEMFVRDIASESRYLYAPLAHRLGLYAIKSELEDLSLKYLNRSTFDKIAKILSESKHSRDQYVEDFIKPIRESLEKTNLKYEIKGRTKSINSIWNKMKKKDIDISEMFDLFAIRIIIDSPLKSERDNCWLAYSRVTDIYTPNISRFKNWIDIPKSNGYESLHITVQGPNNKWVEVQIRTQRMDEIAERGLAAHWRYKGIKSDGEIDKWMTNVREVLEAGSNGQMELIRDMNINLYDKEVFVFTPKGDLFRLPQGASILDFAFFIHTKVGCKCIGGRVDGKNQKLGYKLKSGDTVEILTSTNQTPRLDWLNLVVTSKARNKIRQAVNEARVKRADMAREKLQRRFKNRKIDVSEVALTKLIKKLGYKTITDFYVAIDEGTVDVGDVIEQYIAFTSKPVEPVKPAHETAENFVLQGKAEQEQNQSDDILVIDNNVKGLNYKLMKCCNPIYGDKIMGFVGSDGAIKIHRADCGNVRNLREKYPYRLIKTQWSGKVGSQFAVTLRVVGQDDIGIVSNITSLINKEGDTSLRSISINSMGGLFEGYLVIGIGSLDHLDELIKKIKNLKGVKEVIRANH